MSTRITNAMMVGTFNRNLHKNAQKMETLQSQLATNKKQVRLSDDPVSTVKVLNAKSKQNDLAQYERNLDDAVAWLSNTETALNEANEIIKRVYELAVYAANDTMGYEERVSISDEVAQLRDQLLTLSNSSLGDKYIFGGYNVTSAPFQADLEDDDILLNGNSLIYDDGDLEYISYQISTGTEFEVALSGSQFMGVGEENNMWFQLNEFYKELNNPEQGYESLSAFISSTQKMQSNILANLSIVGGRSARIEMMQERYAQDSLNYTQMRSDVEDLDQAEGIMRFSIAEAVYRAALNVGGRVLQPTLMDFLK